jgi:glutamate synthase (NADPH/NADH) small chain
LDTYGIVPFRLPAAVPLWEASQVRALGVAFRLGVEVGRDLDAAALTEEYDAVVLAVGMGSVPRLGIPGEDAAGVWDALDFIRTAKLGGDVGQLGEAVAVIGGGNTAIDAATCAKRLGVPSVTMYYRRGEDRMTAYDFEIAFAQLEGVEFRAFCLPSRIVTEDDRVAGLELVATEHDGSARPIPGTERIVAADTVVRAIGQTRFTALLEAFGVAHERGVAVVDDRMRTSRASVFAAGDCTFVPGGVDAMVVEAAQRGKIAAASVDAYLRADGKVRHG